VHPPVDERPISTWAVNFEQEGHLHEWLTYHENIGDVDLELNITELIDLAVEYAKKGHIIKFADAMRYPGKEKWEVVAADLNIDLEASRRMFPPSRSPDPPDDDMESRTVTSEVEDDEQPARKKQKMSTAPEARKNVTGTGSKKENPRKKGKTDKQTGVE
jgi:hypothetical protein